MQNADLMLLKDLITHGQMTPHVREAFDCILSYLASIETRNAESDKADAKLGDALSLLRDFQKGTQEFLSRAE